MTDIAKAAGECACDACKAFEESRGDFMREAIAATKQRVAHSANDFYPPNWPRCPHCGDHALDGHITCGRVGCREHGAL